MEETTWRKVLIIDDDELYMQLLEKMLSRHFKVPFIEKKGDAYEGMLFLMSCAKNPDEFPELIVVDIYMPGLDGYDFLELYNENYYQRFPKTKLVVNTSLPSNDAKKRSEKYDFVRLFSSKPIELSHLEGLL